MSPAPAAPLLEGITVLDFTRVLAGPYCTRLLADLGARVLKIERPGEGDDTRRGYFQLEEGRVDQATYFVRINAGKLSVSLDLSNPRGREVVLDLARVADVAVENFVPGVAARIGCGYEAFSKIKPNIVYCSISGFGQTGPLRDTPAFHHIINAVSGIMHLERQTDPVPRIGYLQAADVLAGTHAFGAILAGLVRRGRTGQGAYLDVSMLEAMIAAEDITYGAIINGGDVYPGPRAGMVAHTLEGGDFVMQTVGAPQLFARLCEAMKRPDLADDPRFATPMARRLNWPPLRDLIVRVAGRLRHPRARAAGAAGRAPARLTGAVADRGRRAAASGGPPRVSRDPASHARQGARHQHALPGGRPAHRTIRRRAASDRRAHPPGARRGARLRQRADRGAGPGRRHRRGVTAAGPDEENACSSW